MTVDRPIDKALVALGALLIVLSLVAIPFKGTDTGGGSSSGGGAKTADKVTIKGFAYKPPDVSVKAGTKLTFVNQDSAKHTATDSTTNAFDTGTLTKGQSKAVTITKPGTYSYVCSFHAFMKGKVTVK